MAALENGRTILATEYVRALRFRDVLRGRIEALFDSVDVLMSPSVPFVAPFTDPDIEDGEDGEMLSSGLANLTGQPALSLRCGTSLRFWHCHGNLCPLSIAASMRRQPESRREPTCSRIRLREIQT